MGPSADLKASCKNLISCNEGKMTKNEQRWYEIKYSALCYRLYGTIKQYPLVVEYMELLADIAKIPREQAIRVLQSVTQRNRISPSNTEFIALAREYGATIEETINVLRISKKTYIDLVHKIPSELYVVPQHSTQEVEIMLKLLKAHDILKGTHQL